MLAAANSPTATAAWAGVTGSHRSTSVTTTATTMVPSTASARRRVAGQAPATRRGRRTGTNSAAEHSGAATIPTNRSAANMTGPVPVGGSAEPSSGDYGDEGDRYW